MLLTPDDVKAMINAAENERDRALISVLFEAALRPSELLSMRASGVEFKDNYCLNISMRQNWQLIILHYIRT